MLMRPALLFLSFVVRSSVAAPVTRVAERRAAFVRSQSTCGKFGHRTDHAIVHLDESLKTDPHAFKADILRLGNADEIHYVYTTVAHGVAGKFSSATLEHLLQHDAVASLEADCHVGLPDDQEGEVSSMSHEEVVHATAMTVNRTSSRIKAATSLNTQQGATWGIDRIDSRSGTDNSYSDGGYQGQGALVYVLDTGVRIDHVDFGGRAQPGFSAGTGSSWCPQGVVGSSCSCHAHGTHCASSAAGTTYGVAKRATIIAVQVLSCSGSGSSSGITAGMDWSVRDAATRGQPAVLSMSLGGSGANRYDSEIASAMNAGVVVSVAAGNENTDACTKSPASTLQAVTVGATARAGDEAASFSNYGTCVDLFAPGVAITAAVVSSSTATQQMSGTSMACPHVSGVIAEIRGAFPAMSAQAVVDALLCGAIDGIVGLSSKPSQAGNKFLQGGDELDNYPASCGLSMEPRPPSPPGPPPSPPPPPYTAFWRVTSGNGCEVSDDGACVTDGTGSYGHNEACTAETTQALTATSTEFHLESYYDKVFIGSQRFTGTTGPSNVAMAAGATMSFSSDGSVARGGFTICGTPPPTPVQQPPSTGTPAWCQYFAAFPPSVLQVIVPPCAPQSGGAGQLKKQELTGHREDPDDPNTGSDDPHPCPSNDTTCMQPGLLKKQELVGATEDPDNANTAADDPNPCPSGSTDCVHPAAKPNKNKMQHMLVA